jgi:hypothetical protein
MHTLLPAPSSKTRAFVGLALCLLPLFASAAPVLTLPTSPMKAFSPTSAGGAVNFTVTATDSVDGTVTPTATPPSGSAFPVGDTTVNVSATNSLGQTTTGSFVVRVAASVLTTVDFYRLGETENGTAGANFTTAIDSAGGNNNLTAGAGVTYSTNVGTAVGLNGQSTTCANFAAGNGGLIGQFFNSSFQLDNFGVECFVTADGADGVVVCNRNPSTAGWVIHKSGAEWWVTWDGNRARVLAAPVTIGTRVHLALVRENGIARLFVNGTSVGSTNRAMSNPGTLSRTEIGGTFTGRIDEVRYFTFTGGTFSASELLVNSAIANTVINAAPTVGRDNAAVTVNEGSAATNTGTFSDAQGNATVTLTANVGTVTQNNAAGTWSWSYTPADGPATPTVTITATDNGNLTAAASFNLTVNNVAPTATFAASASSIVAGSATPLTVSFTNQADPSAPDTTAGFTYSYDFNNDGTFEQTNVSSASVTVPQIYYAPSVTSPLVIKGRITDRDGGSRDYTASVTLTPGDGEYHLVAANTNDSGAGSLRAAILAGASQAKTTIDLSALSGTITLASALPAGSGELKIVGPSNPAGLVLQGTTLSVGAGQKLTLSGVTITNSGVGITNHNGSIDISNCSFVNNSGGAISNVIDGSAHNCVIKVQNNSFSGNASGITTTSTGADQHVTFTATGNTFAHGIGIDETEPDGTTAPQAITHVDVATTVNFAGSGAGTFSFSDDDNTPWASFTVNGTIAADNIGITATTVSLGTESVTYGAAVNMVVNAGAGADVVTMTAASPDTPLTVNAGASGGSFALNTSNYTGRVSLGGFGTTSISVDTFSGQLASDTAIQSVTITGDHTGSLSAASFGDIDIEGTLSGSVQTYSNGLITSISISEMSETGNIIAGGVGGLYVWGDLLGTVYLAHPGTITNLYVGASLGGTVTLIEDYPDLTTGVLESMDVGEVSSTGSVFAGRINTVKVAGDMGGTITTSGAGVIQNMFASSISGTVSAKEDVTVNGTTTINGSGQIFASANASKISNATRSQLAYDSKNRVFYVVSNNVLSKLDMDGNELWNVDYGTDWRVGGVVLDTKGNLVVPMTIQKGDINQLFINILEPQYGNRVNFVALLPTGFQQFKGFTDKPVAVCVDPKSGDIAVSGYSYGAIAWNASSNPKTGDLSAVTVAGTDERVWVLRMSSTYNVNYCRDIGATGRKGTGQDVNDWTIGIAPYAETGRSSGWVVAYNGPGIAYSGSYNITNYTKSSVIVRSMFQSDGNATSKPLTLAWKEQKYHNASDVRLTDVYNNGTYVRILGTCSGSSVGVTKAVDSPGSAAIDTWWNNIPETLVTFQYGVKLGLQYGAAPILQATDVTFTNTNAVQASQAVKFSSEAIFSGIKSGTQPGMLAIDNARDYLMQISGPQSISVFDQTGTLVRTLTTSSLIYNDGPGGWWDASDAVTAEFRRICKTPEGFAVVGGVDRYNTRCCFVARFNDDFSVQHNIKYIRNINQVYALTPVGDGGVIVAGSFVGSCDQYLAGGTTVTGPAGVNTTFVGRFLSDNSFSWLSNPTPSNPALEVFPSDVVVNSATPSVFYLMNWANNGTHRLIMCDTSSGARIADKVLNIPGCQAYGALTVGTDGRPTMYGLFDGNINMPPVNLTSSGGESAFAIVFQSPTEAPAAVNIVSGTRMVAPGVTNLNKAYFGVASLVGVSTTGRINYLATEAAPGRVAADTNGNVYQLGKVLGTHSSGLQGQVDRLVRISPNGSRSELLRSDGAFTTNLTPGLNGALPTNVWGDAQFNAITVASDGSIYVAGSVWWSRKPLTFAGNVGNSDGGSDQIFYPGKKVGFVARYSPVPFGVYGYRLAVDMLWRTTDDQRVVVSEKQGNYKNNRIVAALLPAYDEPESIVVKGGACYVAGRFTRCGGLLNGQKPFMGYDSTVENGFLCKINAVALPDGFNIRSGTVTGIWESSWSAPSNVPRRTGTMAVASDNSIFLSYTRSVTNTTTGMGTAAIAKWNANGAYLWECYDENRVTVGLGAYLDTAGNAYLLSRASGNTKFSSTNFTLANAATVNRLTRVGVNANGGWASQKDLGPVVNPGSLNGVINGASIQTANVGGDLTGTIRAAGQGSIGTIEVAGNLSGNISALIDDTPGSGSIGNVSVGGTLSGNVNSTTLTSLNAQTIAPTATITGGQNVTVNEGSVAANGGKFTTLNAATMNVTASVGTVTSSSDGKWSWSHTAGDGPVAAQDVTISGTDGSGGSESTVFKLAISNVAPTASFAASTANVLANPATAPTVSFTSTFDPSTADTAAGLHYAFDFDNDGTFDIGDGTYAGSSATPSASIPLSLLTIPGTDLTVTARIIDKDDGSTAYQTRVHVFTILEAWRFANFSSTENSGAGADAASFTGDGIANLLKFAFGGDPRVSGLGALVFNGTFGSGGTIGATGQPITAFERTATGIDFRALFVRRADFTSAGLTYTPQFSADMVTWQNSTATPVVLADDGTNQIVSVPYPVFIAGKKARFFRINVTAP